MSRAATFGIVDDALIASPPAQAFLEVVEAWYGAANLGSDAAKPTLTKDGLGSKRVVD
jgi:hypothetical protein